MPKTPDGLLPEEPGWLEGRLVMLAELLTRDRAVLLKRWLQLMVETYSPDTAEFLRREQDPFLNPVAHTLSRAAGTVFDELVGGMDEERLSLSLDDMLKIRAVQEFSPSQAVEIVFLLKKAIRDGLMPECRDCRAFEELLELDSRIDRIALLAFETYMRRRERIYEIRANEVRQRSEWLLERLNRIYGTAKQELDLEEYTPGSPDMKRGNGR